MTSIIDPNDIDKHVDEEIYECLRVEKPKSFFLFAGAGSGKTRTLVNVLTDFKAEYGKRLRLQRKKVAVITYTNAACDEIIHRLDYDPIFQVSTIHSFAWDLIKNFTPDIKTWVVTNLKEEIAKLEDEQSRSRDLKNKTSVARAKSILSKNKRLENLPSIKAFKYNPNGDNITKDSLNHAEVINLAAKFILDKPLMQDIVASQYPIILIDESQDTIEKLIDSFFSLQKNKKDVFSLGLFGDTMQRIYFDGKEKLGENLPPDWVTPAKRMNHRSNKRIITLINAIRKNDDGQVQQPRAEKPEGFVRLFLCKRGKDKESIEADIAKKMEEVTGDPLWNSSEDSNRMTLILEHHMAARRMGFSTLFEPLYKEQRLATGVLDGTLAGLTFFTKIILPLIEAYEQTDEFAKARIIKEHSVFLKKDELKKSLEQFENLKKSKDALVALFNLWDGNANPSLKSILQSVRESGIFQVPESLLPILSKDESKEAVVASDDDNEPDEDSITNVFTAWETALEAPFSEIRAYNLYLSKDSQFGTHQGVKGLEFDRVMLIMDDEESRGFSFSYDKLFGAKELSRTDTENLANGIETGIDKTRRLFYVACSRAKQSLAIVAYSDSPATVQANALKYKWFAANEIVMLS